MISFKKLIYIFLVSVFSCSAFAADEKPGRFFEGQPDITDDYQIHFSKGGYYIWGVEDNIATR